MIDEVPPCVAHRRSYHRQYCSSFVASPSRCRGQLLRLNPELLVGVARRTVAVKNVDQAAAGFVHPRAIAMSKKCRARTMPIARRRGQAATELCRFRQMPTWNPHGQKDVGSVACCTTESTDQSWRKCSHTSPSVLPARSRRLPSRPAPRHAPRRAHRSLPGGGRHGFARMHVGVLTAVTADQPIRCGVVGVPPVLLDCRSALPSARRSKWSSLASLFHAGHRGVGVPAGQRPGRSAGCRCRSRLPDRPASRSPREAAAGLAMRLIDETKAMPGRAAGLPDHQTADRPRSHG